MKICSCQAISCHQEASFVTRRHLPTIRITFGGQNIESLLDTGAMIALLDFELGQGLPLDLIHRTDKSIPAFSCSGEKLQIMGSILSHLSFNRNMPPIWAEFYLLKNSTQKCIIPHPWLEQLSAIINYNTSTLSFKMPKKGFFLSAEGPLQKSNLKYKYDYKYKYKRRKENHHISSTNHNHDGHHDQLANHQYDHNDDNDGVASSDDNNEDNHQNNGDDIDDVDGEHQINLSLLGNLKVPPKQCASRVIAGLKTSSIMFPTFSACQQTNITACIRPTKSGQSVLTVYNDNPYSVSVNLSSLKWNQLPESMSTVPIKIEKWCINNVSASIEEIEKATEEHQSTFSTQSTLLQNISLSQTKIPFTIPANIKGHPFDEKSSPLVIFHVYLLHLLGSNYKYMLKSDEELSQIVSQNGLKSHIRTLANINSLFEKAKIQQMYSKMSLYVVGLVHVLFLITQKQQRQIEQQNPSTADNKARKLCALNQQLVRRLKALAALYFYNQKLINRFYEETLKHPYLSLCSLPLSFENTLQKLGVYNNDDNDDNDGNVIKNNDHRPPKNGNDDDIAHNNARGAHHGSTSVVANVMIHPPIALNSKDSLSQVLCQSVPEREGQRLNFQQYCEILHAECNAISKAQLQQTRKSKFSSKTPNLATLSPDQLKQFISYAKSPRRLVDFLETQVPREEPPNLMGSVESLLESIPDPRWIFFDSQEQILDQYIPECLREDFYIFYNHFKDPVFIRYSGIFPLPYPPTIFLNQTDPPDPLHSNTGLIDPRVLASVVCQCLSHDHPLISNPAFDLELLHLACILYIFGQFNVSLHSYDCGWFRQELEVKTLLAATAPTFSFPSKSATQATSEDLDERIEFLQRQGKCHVILGSPFLAQISSVPKNYKSGKVIHSSRSDPVLRYISQLSNPEKLQLSRQSQEITQKQNELISLLGQSALSEPVDLNSQQSSVNLVSTLPGSSLLDQNCHQLQIFVLSSVAVNKKDLIMESASPPTQTELSHFNRARAETTNPAKQRQQLKVRFGKVFVFVLVTHPEDVLDRLSYQQCNKYWQSYYLSPENAVLHKKRYNSAAVGTFSKRLLGSEERSTDKAVINYISEYNPNIAQLAKSRLSLDYAKSQQYLANVNNVHHCIEQLSSHGIFNRISPDDSNYQFMSQLAQDTRFLVNSHSTNMSNTTNHDLAAFCYNVTLKHSKEATGHNQWDTAKMFGHINVPRPGSHLFVELANSLVSSMRRLDHKGPLKSSHEINKNVEDLLKSLQSRFSSQNFEFSKSDLKSITIEQIVKNAPWTEFLDCLSTHYQLPAIWLFVEVNHNSRNRQQISLLEVFVSNCHLADSKQRQFLISALNCQSFENCRVRFDSDFCLKVLDLAREQEWSKPVPMPEFIDKMLARNQEMNNGDQSGKPRHTKVKYDHINKNFYQKNAIHRIINNSKDTNKLARPVLSRAVQSQGEILNNLGSSEIFSNFDLTACYDSVPADPISQLINCASYRNQEFIFLCASQGGANSCVFTQRAVSSLMYKIRDRILLQPCYQPNSVKFIAPQYQNQYKTMFPPEMSSEDSWQCRPNLHLPGPKIVKQVQSVLFAKNRSTSSSHYLPMNEADRHKLLSQNTTDKLISNAALIDDLVTCSKGVNSAQYRQMSEEQKLRLHYRIHTFILLSIFSAINSLSAPPGDRPPFKATAKLKLEKSSFAAESLRYLNIVYLRGYRAIDLDNFKRSNLYISELPNNGDELRSAIGFFSFLLSFVPNLRFYLKHLNVLAGKHSAKKVINWENFPEIRSTYLTLCQVVQNNTALHTLPDDLSQVHRYVINSDACNASLSYLVGIVLCSDENTSQETRQTIRPIKYYSVRLEDFCKNLSILLKECLAALISILKELPQIRLLPPSCQKVIIVDSAPLFGILSNLQKNGCLDKFYVAHASMPLWFSRLYQLTSQYEIQVLLLPTKLAPPADFLTRKFPDIPENLSCPEASTNKRVVCSVCPGCGIQCIRKTPHSDCPFSVRGSPDKTPNLLKPNKIVKKQAVIDNKTIQFNDNQIEVNWKDFQQVDFGPFLSESCYSINLENLSEESLLKMAAEDYQLYQMSEQGQHNLHNILSAQQAASALLSTQNKNNSSQHHDHQLDQQHDHRQQSVNHNEHDHHSGKDDHNNDHNHGGDDHNGGDDDHPKQVHHIQSNTKKTSNNFLFCDRSEKHICFELNFCILREYVPREMYTLKHPHKTVVIVFVTQKKQWHRQFSYHTSLLADTAASSLAFNPGQVQQLVVDKVSFVIMCVSADTEKNESLSGSTLLPNLQKCLREAGSAYNIYYDVNSILSTYQCHIQSVIQAIQFIAKFNPAYHCIYSSFNEKMSFSLPPLQLQLELPLIHNYKRAGILSVKLESSFLPQFVVKQFRKNLEKQIQQIIPLSNLGKRTIAFLRDDNAIVDFHSSGLIDISRFVRVLVKDSQVLQCAFNKGNSRNSKVQINLIACQPLKDETSSSSGSNKSSSSSSSSGIDSCEEKLTFQQELERQANIQAGAFSVAIKSPLSPQFFSTMLDNNINMSQPTFSTRMPVSELKKLCNKYHICSVKLHSKEISPKPTFLGNGVFVNNINKSWQEADLLRHHLANFSLLFVSQAQDELIQSIISRAKTSSNALIQENAHFRLYDDILYGKPSGHDIFRPVLPDSRLIPLIISLHGDNCLPPRNIIRKIKKAYCHLYDVTSRLALEKTVESLVPCYKCLALTPAHASPHLQMQVKTIALQAQGVKMCTFVAMDVFYLADPLSKTFLNNYISIILCQSCKFVSLKPISRITSYNLAQHLYSFVEITGRIPTVLISDAASNNVYLEMKKLLRDFQLIHVTANQNIISNITAGSASENEDNDDNNDAHDNHDNHDNRGDNDDDNDNVDDNDQHNYDDKDHDEHHDQHDQQSNYNARFQPSPLDLLSSEHKRLLLQDLKESQPPLFPPVLRHTPISYKATKSSRNTSLGSLDHICKRLQLFLRKNLSFSLKTRDFQQHAELLISAFQFQVNFYLPAETTQLVPAQLHLGAVQASNIMTLSSNVQKCPLPQSQVVSNMQQLLKYARNVNLAQENAVESNRKAQERQIREKGRVKDQGSVFEKFHPLDVLFVKTELSNESKLTTAARFSGPVVILSVHPVSEQLNLFDLLTAQVMTKNYKQVREVFSRQVFSLPLYPHLGEEIQFRIVEPTSRIRRTENAQNVLVNSTKIILNVHKLLMFLAPILPNRSNTQAFLRTVHVKGQDDGDDGGDNEDGDDPVVETMQNDNDDDNANDGDIHNDGDDQIKLVHRPSVKFSLPSPEAVNVNDNDHNTSNDTGNHENDNGSDDDNDNDDIGGDGVDHLHLQFSDSNSIPANPSNATPLPKDIVVPKRPKNSSPSSISRNKYNLRQNPKSKNVFDI